jgi:branched-chain amino acid transport system substrate-binding protein
MISLMALRNSTWRLISAGLLAGITAVCLAGCAGETPVRVGFVAQLSGVQSELGMQERNGVQLAVDEINAAGGSAGRPIELIVQDDLGTPDGAQAADRKLIESGVQAIIGHATSAQTLAGLAVTNPARIVMISPTATTPELSGKADYFFRVGYSLVDRARSLAHWVFQGRHIAQAAIIYDTDNVSYSKPFMEAFSSEYRSLGGRLVGGVEFSALAKPDFASLILPLRASSPEGLLIIASDNDTALIAQRTRLMGWSIQLFGTAWAQTDNLITDGGQAVEGLEIELANTLNNQSPEYLDFAKHYQARFGQTHAFGATAGYEAAQVLAAALRKTGGKAEGLAQALLSIPNFKGLSDTISFDKYGDVKRPIYLGVIRDSRYVEIEPVNLTEP